MSRLKQISVWTITIRAVLRHCAPATCSFDEHGEFGTAKTGGRVTIVTTPQTCA